MRISATISFVGRCTRLTVPEAICCRMKAMVTAMCLERFVRCPSFSSDCLAACESVYNVVGVSIACPMSDNIPRHQIVSFVAKCIAYVSASMVDNETELWSFDVHNTGVPLMV